MRVLSFPNFSKNRAPVTAKDWSQQEIADFYRAHRLLVENGAGIGIDRGVSDIGEPWMVFYDAATQDVFMHVARISGRCILICEQLGIHLKAPEITTLIADFENAVRHHLAVRTERNSNVVIHPAARIIMSISMVFLLFKLDNSNAHAKGLADNRGHHTPAELAARAAADPSAATPAQRVQSAFARLLETVDTPTSAAVLAGIILAGELAISTQSAAVESHHQDIVLPHELVIPVETAAEASTRMFTTGESRSAPEEARTVQVHTPVVTTQDIALDAKDISKSEDALAGKAATLLAAHQDSQAAEMAAPVVKNDVALATASLAMAQDKAQETTADQSPQSIKTLETLFGWDLDGMKDTDTVAAISIGRSTPGGAAAPVVNQITDISVAALDTIDDHVGFFLRTALPDDQLREMLVHFISSFGHYEIEYSGGKVLIEQSNMASLADHDIGLWTNMMADGSSISVVGQANLIDDVAGIFS